MDIDDTRRDDLALDVDNLGGLICDVRSDAGELAVLNGDIHHAVALGGGVDDGAALQDQVVHGVITPSVDCECLRTGSA